MKVRVYPSDGTGCGWYRCQEPARVARDLGVHVTVADIPPPAAPGQAKQRLLPIERHPANPTLVRAVPVDADVIVFQRPFEEEIARVLIPQLQAAGKAIVVELDDDVERIDPRHPGHRVHSPKFSPFANTRFLREACRQADLITVTTPALANRYGQHGRVAVLPNCVPARLLHMTRTSDGETVGWRGWTVTHPGDLRVTAGGVQDALSRTGARFLQVGSPDGVRADLALHDEPEATGGLWNIDDFYQALGRLDVGIVPLADTQFNDAKSYLAGLEYAARGVPFVASPVTEYRRLSDLGLGTLARNRARDWSRPIERLLTDKTRRAETAERGREIVASHHTYEKRGHIWCEAWQEALATARGRRAPVAA